MPTATDAPQRYLTGMQANSGRELPVRVVFIEAAYRFGYFDRRQARSQVVFPFGFRRGPDSIHTVASYLEHLALLVRDAVIQQIKIVTGRIGQLSRRQLRL